jgi:hypothetical protein
MSLNQVLEGADELLGKGYGTPTKEQCPDDKPWEDL